MVRAMGLGYDMVRAMVLGYLLKILINIYPDSLS